MTPTDLLAHTAPLGYNWVAMDRNGAWYAHQSMPKACTFTDTWYSSDKKPGIRIHSNIILEFNSWEDTLHGFVGKCCNAAKAIETLTKQNEAMKEALLLVSSPTTQTTQREDQLTCRNTLDECDKIKKRDLSRAAISSPLKTFSITEIIGQ